MTENRLLSAVTRAMAWLPAGTLLWPAAAAGLVIVRWGGESRPPPGDEGARFVQVPWTDLHADRGGEAFQLAIDRGAIAARRLDPEHDLGPEILARGGVLPEEAFGAFDGDAETVWVPDLYECDMLVTFFQCDDIYSHQGTVNIDLGGLFPLDRIRLVSGVTDPTYVVRDFRIHLAPKLPGSLLFGTGPLRPVAAEVRDNREAARDILLPGGQRVRFLQVAMAAHRQPWAVHEIGIYARGFLERSTYVSDVLDFGAPVIWGPLRWEGRKGSRAVVSVHTRSGLTADPNLYWRYTGRGGEKVRVSRAEYEGLKFAQRAGTTLDRDHWTFWAAYGFADSAGTPVLSAAPRRFFQLMVDFRPNDEEAEVRAVEVRASPPVATDLVGEVWPVAAAAGESTPFTYAVRPLLGSLDPGFDRLELTSPSLLESVDAVRVGGDAIGFSVEALEPHRVELALPRLGPADSGTLLEVDFRARVLNYGAGFEARVFDSSRPLELKQRVNPGDASPAFEGNGVGVSTAVRERLLRARVELPLLTPNGDGRNDEACVDYDVLDIAGAVPVDMRIHDLAGRLVRRVYGGRDGTGNYRRCWDGRDEAGRMAPPGLYVYEVSLDTDGRDVRQAGVLGVGY